VQEEISFGILQTLVSFSEELNKRKQHTFWTKIKMSSFWARARQNFRDFATINKPEAPGHPGACNRSPGSKLLSITTQLHCGGHLGGDDIFILVQNVCCFLLFSSSEKLTSVCSIPNEISSCTFHTDSTL
jgi:hypothetical protein